MFPVGCARNSATYSVKVKLGNTQLAFRAFNSANNVVLNATGTLLAAGTYSVEVRLYGNPGANEIYDYTYKVYSENGGITIKDSTGKTSELGVRDDSSCVSTTPEPTPTPEGKNSTIPAEFTLCCLSARLDMLEGNDDVNTKFAI
jgi:hypothetical protein